MAIIKEEGESHQYTLCLPCGLFRREQWKLHLHLSSTCSCHALFFSILEKMTNKKIGPMVTEDRWHFQPVVIFFFFFIVWLFSLVLFFPTTLVTSSNFPVGWRLSVRVDGRIGREEEMELWLTDKIVSLKNEKFVKNVGDVKLRVAIREVKKIHQLLILIAMNTLTARKKLQVHYTFCNNLQIL